MKLAIFQTNQIKEKWKLSHFKLWKIKRKEMELFSKGWITEIKRYYPDDCICRSSALLRYF